MRGKIVVFWMVDIDLRGLREPLENRPYAVRRDRRRPNVLFERQQQVPSILLTPLVNCIRPLSTVSECLLHELCERPLVERREHWSALRWWVHVLPVAPEWRNHRIWKAGRVPLLFLPVDVHALVLQRDIFLPNTRRRRSFGSRRSSRLGQRYIRERTPRPGHEPPSAPRSGLVVCRGEASILRKYRVRLDGVTGSFLDVAGERVALLGRPSLLVAGLAAVVLRERRYRTCPLCVMRLEVPLADAPSAPGRDITVVGLNSILLEAPIAGEMPCVLPEDPSIEVLEDGLSVDVVGGDAGPVVVATLTGGPFSESLKLAGCVALVISAVATAIFSLVLEVPLEAGVERRR